MQRITLFLLILISFFLQANRPQAAVNESIYELGAQRLETGNWQMALRIWRQAFRAYQETGFFDPRIGFQFIEVATKYEAVDFYDEASTWYSLAWGSYDPTQAELQPVYELELRRLYLIMPDDVRKKAETQFKKKDKALGATVNEYWESMNEIMSTSRNERLIEHWQRIQEAREKYTRNKLSVYGCDARGELYVMYGKPNTRRQVNLPVTGYTDPNTLEFREFELGAMGNIEVEVWRYFQPGGQDIVYYLGNHIQAGKGYGYWLNLFDVVPYDYLDNTSFTGSTGGGMSPNSSTPRSYTRAIAKLAVIEQLSRLDQGAAQVYNDLAAELLATTGGTRGNNSTIWQVMNRFQMDHTNRVVPMFEKERPATMSNVVNNTIKVPLVTHFYRVQEMDGSTTYLVLYSADVADIITKESFFNMTAQIGESDFSVAKTVAISDKNNQIVTRLPEKFDYGTLSSMPVYNLVVNEKDVEGKLFASLDLLNKSRLKMNKDNLTGTDSHTMSLVVTTGRSEVKLPEPLPKKGFAVSDIFVGLDEYDLERRIPLLPLMNKVFVPNQEIAIYFEVYRPPMEDYSVDIYFNRGTGLFLKRKMDDKGTVSLRNKAYDGVDQQLFNFTFEGFTPGDYEMVIEITSGKTTHKKVTPIKIIEAEN